LKLCPQEAGLKSPSFAKIEYVRSVSKERLLKRWGGVSPKTMAEVADRLRVPLDL
jgi:mRNA-degrading endonuclease toxin of MazEF toxin-antitoxin module